MACALPDAAIEELTGLGGGVIHRPELTPDELPAALQGVGVLVVDRLKVSGEALEAGRGLQMVVRAGAGSGEIALEQASALGIFVTHCPDRDAVAAAEIALAYMLLLDRGLGAPGQVPRAALGLSGATLGILGDGAAARVLEERAGACGMDVACWAPRVADAAAAARPRFCRSRRELAARSEFVVSMAAEGESDLRVEAEFLDSLRPGAVFVHVGGPATLQESAVIRAAGSGRLAMAFDLTDSRDAARLAARLRELPGVCVSENLAGRTRQAHLSTASAVVHVVRQFLAAGQPLHCINLLERSPATWQLVLRLRDAVGVLAGIMEAIRADGVNAEEITSRVFAGARAAWCTIALDERPSGEALAAIRGLDGVLHLDLRAVV